MTRRCAILSALFPLLLAGCSQFPELDAALPTGITDTSYPDLVPVETLLGDTSFDPDTADKTAKHLEARTRALQARAERLRRRDQTDS